MDAEQSMTKPKVLENGNTGNSCQVSYATAYSMSGSNLVRVHVLYDARAAAPSLAVQSSRRYGTLQAALANLRSNVGCNIVCQLWKAASHCNQDRSAAVCTAGEALIISHG